MPGETDVTRLAYRTTVRQSTAQTAVLWHDQIGDMVKKATKIVVIV